MKRRSLVVLLLRNVEGQLGAVPPNASLVAAATDDGGTIAVLASMAQSGSQRLGRRIAVRADVEGVAKPHCRAFYAEDTVSFSGAGLTWIWLGASPCCSVTSPCLASSGLATKLLVHPEHRRKGVSGAKPSIGAAGSRALSVLLFSAPRAAAGCGRGPRGPGAGSTAAAGSGTPCRRRRCPRRTAPGWPKEAR